MGQQRIAAESKDKSGIDVGRVPVSTPHGSPGTQTLTAFWPPGI